MKIVVIKLGALGDLIRTIPIVQTIKKINPDSELTWITKENGVSILKKVKEISNIYSTPYQTNEEFDLLYNFDIDKEATDLAMSLNAKKKYGFYSESGYASSFNFGAEYYLNTLFDDELKKSNTLTYQKMMFNAAEIPSTEEQFILPLSEEEREYANLFAIKNNLPNKNLIGIHLGASQRWPSKVWHPDNLKEFIVKAKQKGYNLFVFGGPKERDYLSRIKSELNTLGIEISVNNPNNSILEFASLIEKCDYMICFDSFSLHLSLALKKPTFALFFCTSHKEIEDYGLLKKIVSPRLNEFFPEKMDQYDEGLVKSISAEEVLKALEDY